MGETWVQSLGWEDPLEERKATHSSILAWRIPWTVQSMGAQSRTPLSNFYFTSSLQKEQRGVNIIGNIYFSVVLCSLWGRYFDLFIFLSPCPLWSVLWVVVSVYSSHMACWKFRLTSPFPPTALALEKQENLCSVCCFSFVITSLKSHPS